MQIHFPANLHSSISIFYLQTSFSTQYSYPCQNPPPLSSPPPSCLPHHPFILPIPCLNVFSISSRQVINDDSAYNVLIFMPMLHLESLVCRGNLEALHLSQAPVQLHSLIKYTNEASRVMLPNSYKWTDEATVHEASEQSNTNYAT